jgi:putative oxidoreductase
MQVSTGSWAMGTALIRMIVGCLLIYHGAEVFMPDKMKGYAQWMGGLRYPAPALFAYAGKTAELIGGISLLLGLWVRIFSAPLILTLLLITFTMGHGKIFTDDQHPFVIALLCAVFFFNGAGIWSIDAALHKKSVIQNK